MRKMLTFALVLAGAFSFVPAASAQFTTVTATVTDPNGIPYASGTMSAVLTPSAPGGFRLSGQPYSGRVGPVTLDSTGTFTANFGSVTQITPSAQWQITINSNPGGISPPLGTGGQTFTVTTTGTVISGSSVNISATLTAAAPKLTNFGGGSSLISGSVTPTHLTFASGVDTIGDVLGSAVTAGTGALALTASGDAVTPFSVFGHSSSESVPAVVISADGSTNCPGSFTFSQKAALCISTNNNWAVNLIGSDPILNLFDTASGTNRGQIDYGNYSLVIHGQGSDGNTAYITLGDDFAPQQSNTSIYSELWTYFGSNGNLSWKDAINSQTGQIRAGWIPDKAGQMAQGGFLSVVDGPFAHEVNIKNPGTMAANFNFNMPITAGSAGQPLLSQAGGTTPMTWGAISGTGSFCLTTSCVMTTPNLGTPSAATLTNATGLPFSGIASGTNATAAMLVGSGASLGTSGTGTINATTLGGATFPVPIGSTTCGTCPINNPTINVDQGMIQLSLGAGYLNIATQPFSIQAGGNYTSTAASSPALNFEVQLCTIIGCGSGTVVDLIDITTTTLSATALSNATWTLSATCVINATGATGNLVCKGSPGLTLDTGASIVTPDSTFADTNSVVSGNIDLTAALFLRFTVAQSVAGASNSYTQTLASIR